jgi:hypothetical protein
MEGMVLSGVFGATALLLIGLSVPLIRRRVRPNRFYGFRTPATLKNEPLWYEVNARTGRDLLVVGLGTVGLTVFHVAGMISEPVFALTSAAWMTSGALWSVVHGFVIIRSFDGPRLDGAEPRSHGLTRSCG